MSKPDEHWVLVPREPAYATLSELARKWGYTLEETAEAWGLALDVLSVSPLPLDPGGEPSLQKAQGSVDAVANGPMQEMLATYRYQQPTIGSEGQPYRSPTTEPPASPAPGPADRVAEWGEFLEYEDLSRTQPGAAEPVVKALRYRVFRQDDGWAVDAESGIPHRPVARCMARADAERLVLALTQPAPAPVAGGEVEALRDLLDDAAAAVRQALVDAAHVHRSTEMKPPSAFFKAETIATNAIDGLKNRRFPSPLREA